MPAANAQRARRADRARGVARQPHSHQRELEQFADVVLVIDDEDVNTYLSFRNIPTVNILPVSAAHTYELIDNKALVFTADALKRIEEVLA